MNRQEVTFQSGDDRCAGWWYTPEEPGRRPFVVMAHGMGATRELGLDAVARRFCAAGLCVLAFDYRHYGASTGEPRELLSVSRQLADYRAAFRYASQRPEVDPERGALWGFSFSAGHVMALSAERLGARAHIAQQPFSSGSRAQQTMSKAYSRRVRLLAVADLLAQLLRREPVYMPLLGPADSIALMSNDEAARDYPRMIPSEVLRAGRWRDRVAVRSVLGIARYEPAKQLSKAGPPVLVIVGESDTMTPAAFTLPAAQRSRRVQLLRYPGGHLDHFLGPGLERAVADQLRFLEQHLGFSRADSRPEAHGIDSSGQDR